jgi:hypothetical protein
VTAEIIALPPRVPNDPEADTSWRLSALVPLLGAVPPQSSALPPLARISPAIHTERVRLLIDMADAFGIDLRMAAAMQASGSWGGAVKAPAAAEVKP